MLSTRICSSCSCNLLPGRLQTYSLGIKCYEMQLMHLLEQAKISYLIWSIAPCLPSPTARPHCRLLSHFVGDDLRPLSIRLKSKPHTPCKNDDSPRNRKGVHGDGLPCPSGDCYVYGTTTYVRTVGPTDHLGHDHVDLAGLYS